MKNLAVLAFLGLSFQAISATNSYFQPLDVNALHSKEIAVEQKGEAPSFAVPHKVSVKPTWEKSSAGYVWTHEVEAPNAVSLNFGFSKFHLPEGAELNIYSQDRTQFIRTFTAQDNNEARELWTPIITADKVVIEVTVPETLVSEVDLELAQIGQGFRTFGQSTNKAGSCNVDVACSESAGWEKEVNSVAVISTGGSRFCTGFMVNNTSNDRTPFFMTANHCRINKANAASLVVYWNYQTAQCKGPRNGKLTNFQTGATHLVSGTKSDFTLVKLNSQPNEEWNVNYAGWDATGRIGFPAVAIHHPNTDEKSISFENDPTLLSSYGGPVPGDETHVKITNWDVGTTEPGSSGSPLFDDNHRVVGQLHGGRAACGNNGDDYYGRFHTSWGLGLKEHLDSANTGDETTDTI